MKSKLIAGFAILLIVAQCVSAERYGVLLDDRVIDAPGVDIWNASENRPRVGEEFDVYRLRTYPGPHTGRFPTERKIGRVRVTELISEHSVRAQTLWGLSQPTYVIKTR